MHISQKVMTKFLSYQNNIYPAFDSAKWLLPYYKSYFNFRHVFCYFWFHFVEVDKIKKKYIIAFGRFRLLPALVFAYWYVIVTWYRGQNCRKLEIHLEQNPPSMEISNICEKFYFRHDPGVMQWDSSFSWKKLAIKKVTKWCTWAWP